MPREQFQAELTGLHSALAAALVLTLAVALHESSRGERAPAELA